MKLKFLLEEAEEQFPKKSVLTMEDIASYLECDPKIIYNWTRRSDPSRRPPKIIVGKQLRFPKRDFFRWLAAEQGTQE
jgi:NADPH-dependent ferric siderophore reductase